MEIKKLQKEKGYKSWLAGLKQKVRGAQLKAAVTVNRELLEFYWELGAEIVDKQAETDWGSKFLSQLSADLTDEFPDIKGFSLRNLKYIRQWYLFYSETNEIGQQAVAQFDQKQKQGTSRQAVAQNSKTGNQAIGQQPVGQLKKVIAQQQVRGNDTRRTQTLLGNID